MFTGETLLKGDKVIRKTEGFRKEQRKHSLKGLKNFHEKCEK